MRTKIPRISLLLRLEAWVLKNCHCRIDAIESRIAVAVVERTEKMRSQKAQKTEHRHSDRQHKCLDGEELWQP